MFLLLRSSSFEHVRPGHNVPAKVGHNSMGSLRHPGTIGQCCWSISVRVLSWGWWYGVFFFVNITTLLGHMYHTMSTWQNHISKFSYASGGELSPGEQSSKLLKLRSIVAEKKVISKLKWSFQIACDWVTSSRPFFLDEYLVRKYHLNYACIWGCWKLFSSIVWFSLLKSFFV